MKKMIFLGPARAALAPAGGYYSNCDREYHPQQSLPSTMRSNRSIINTAVLRIFTAGFLSNLIGSDPCTVKRAWHTGYIFLKHRL